MTALSSVPPIKIAIATSKTPDNLDSSERLLMEALTQKGISVSSTIWSEEMNWRQFSMVVVRSCWDYHLRVREFLTWIARLEAQGITVVNHPALIRWNANKRYLKDFFAAGVTIPDTVWLGTGEEVDVAEICAARGWADAVVKPVVSASAHGTERRRTGQAQGPAMIQQYLPAIESEGEWSLMYFGGEFSHAVRKRPRAEDFRVQKDFGGSAEAASPPPGMLDIAASALRVLPHEAVFARVDLVEQDGTIYLMEMEVIEPELFLEYAAGSEQRLAELILNT